MTSFFSKDRPRLNDRPTWLVDNLRVLPHLLFDPLQPTGNWACYVKLTGDNEDLQFASQLFTLDEIQPLLVSWFTDPEACLQRVFGVNIAEFLSNLPKEPNPNEPV